MSFLLAYVAFLVVDTLAYIATDRDLRMSYLAFKLPGGGLVAYAIGRCQAMREAP